MGESHDLHGECVFFRPKPGNGSDASSFVGLVAGAGASAASAVDASLHGSLMKVLEQARGHIEFTRKLSHFAPISPDVHGIHAFNLPSA